MWRGCAGESEGGEMATPSSLALAAGGDGYRAAFTAVQWQELEHQALIYKYLVAGLPVPPDLVLPIRRSFEALSARFFHHAPAPLGYCSYYGKKFDHEPGRCRRTDGKKWRCSKDAYPDSKYCERHMHRGRNRSRKPVESQSTPRLLSTRVSGVTAVSSSGTDSGSGSYPSVGNGNFQNLPVHSVINSEVLGFGTNIPKYQVESNQYGISSKNYRYARGIISDMGEHSYSSEASASATSLGMDRNIESTWCLRPTQVQSFSFVKPSNDSYLQSNPSKLDMQQTSASIIDTSMTKLKEQHCFIGSEIGSPLPINCEQHSMHPVLDGWPKSIEPWSCPDDESKKAFSMTHLSTSMLMAPSEFMARRNCSPNDD